MTWVVEGRLKRDRVARALTKEIGYDEAYKAVASDCFDDMFERVEKYPDHTDHTVENLVARVKQFIIERQKAKESEREFQRNGNSSALYRSRPYWDERVRKGDYFFARYESLCQKLKKVGVMEGRMYFPSYFYNYVNVEETYFERDEAIAFCLLHQTLLTCDRFEASSYAYAYLNGIIRKKYVDHLSWIEAGILVCTPLTEEVNDESD